MVEMLAQNYLKKGGICYPPVPSELVSVIADKQSVEVRLVPITNYHGAIWRIKEGWVIQLKESDPPDEQRLTLFHETFHMVAHIKSTPVFSRRGHVPAPFNEMLASYFAVCILMPGKWIKEEWAELRDIKKTAEIFGVPQRTVVFRLKRLGLI